MTANKVDKVTSAIPGPSVARSQEDGLSKEIRNRPNAIGDLRFRRWSDTQ